MKKFSNLLSKFYEDSQKLSNDEFNRIDRFGGLDIQEIARFLTNPIDYTVDFPEQISPSDVKDCAVKDSYSLGEKSFNSGEVCVVFYTSQNTLPCVVRLPFGMSLIGLKHIQTLDVNNVWCVVPANHYDEVKITLASQTNGDKIKLFKQYESLSLEPDNTLQKIDGAQQFYSCGSGDISTLLSADSSLQNFIENGGKYLYFLDVANLLAIPDLNVLGNHILDNNLITYEVVKSQEKENRPVACNFLGVNQVVERFRISAESDYDFDWTATGSFVMTATALTHTHKLPWHRMKRNVNGRLTIQYERFINDITSSLKTNFIEVNRDERYHLLKDENDLKNLNNTLKLNDEKFSTASQSILFNPRNSMAK